jgi:hypothetical protein
LKELFELNTTCIRQNEEISEPVDVIKGLAQGSKINPLLFNIFIDDIINKIESTEGNRGMQVCSTRMK